MTLPSEKQNAGDGGAWRGPDPDIPRPVIKKMRWPFPIVWIVPLAAAVLAGYFLYERHRQQGKEISIEFPDGNGIIAGQTQMLVHGISVGEVKSIELSEDHQHAIAHVRLNQADAFIAKKGTLIWVVRPQLSLSNISGLNTLVSGPYIEALPGEGDEETHFYGRLNPPVLIGSGIRIILHGERLEHISPDSPLTYRGIQVGEVQDIRLSDEADAANITVYVWSEYIPLVRSNSQFWIIKGADIQGGLFGGLKLKLDSLSALLAGGIAFATPDEPGAVVSDGGAFDLNENSKDEWLKWKPKIRLPRVDSVNASEEKTIKQDQNSLPALKKD
jgi:paraquat-inducible protein B